MFSDNNEIKLEINDRKTTEKFSNTWKLNTLLNNPQVNEEVSKERKIHRADESVYTAYQNLWDAVKSVMRRTIVALNTNIRKEGNYPGSSSI